MPIGLYDADQTHDLLWANCLSSQISGQIAMALGDHGFTLSPTPIALIERIIVGANLPWADNWTGQVFEFLRCACMNLVLSSFA